MFLAICPSKSASNSFVWLSNCEDRNCISVWLCFQNLTQCHVHILGMQYICWVLNEFCYIKVGFLILLFTFLSSKIIIVNFKSLQKIFLIFYHPFFIHSDVVFIWNSYLAISFSLPLPSLPKEAVIGSYFLLCGRKVLLKNCIFFLCDTFRITNALHINYW